ncbi:hypothetical protein P0136_08085 [Lentisphaerota bacterium ZTH]|nr:hypothetical protein JYG24_00805 [Lentisphaerota bacterium]WET05322.1 hypothetical protein P0136_08085 [Lentisphaerota bacterium ZTH]
MRRICGAYEFTPDKILSYLTMHRATLINTEILYNSSEEAFYIRNLTMAERKTENYWSENPTETWLGLQLMLENDMLEKGLSGHLEEWLRRHTGSMRNTNPCFAYDLRVMLESYVSYREMKRRQIIGSRPVPDIVMEAEESKYSYKTIEDMKEDIFKAFLATCYQGIVVLGQAHKQGDYAASSFVLEFCEFLKYSRSSEALRPIVFDEICPGDLRTYQRRGSMSNLTGISAAGSYSNPNLAAACYDRGSLKYEYINRLSRLCHGPYFFDDALTDIKTAPRTFDTAEENRQFAKYCFMQKSSHGARNMARLQNEAVGGRSDNLRLLNNEFIAIRILHNLPDESQVLVPIGFSHLFTLQAPALDKRVLSLQEWLKKLSKSIPVTAIRCFKAAVPEFKVYADNAHGISYEIKWPTAYCLDRHRYR